MLFKTKLSILPSLIILFLSFSFFSATMAKDIVAYVGVDNEVAQKFVTAQIVGTAESMGVRLNTSKNMKANFSVIYRKGAIKNCWLEETVVREVVNKGSSELSAECFVEGYCHLREMGANNPDNFAYLLVANMRTDAPSVTEILCINKAIEIMVKKFK